MMKYSFIIPVYNCKSYLPACVESILAAGAEEFEILLVDDGSTDGSGALCDRLAVEHSPVRVLHKPNGGVSSARNAGIAAARGDYVLFLDADDSLDGASLKEILSDPRCQSVDMTIFGIRFDYYRQGRCYRRDPIFYSHDGILDRAAWAASFAALFDANSLSPVWNKIFRRDILTENSLTLREDMFLYEDLEFTLRYLLHCGRVWNVPRPVYRYRQSEDEGNAGRRLRRVSAISELLAPIQEVLSALTDVTPSQREQVIVTLFQTLAREKIAVSTLPQIRALCADYAAWYQNGHFSAGETPLHYRLMSGSALTLLLQSKKTGLRHRVAVWAKAHHLYKRK